MNNGKGNVVSDVAKGFVKKKIILFLLGGSGGAAFSAILIALPLFIALLVVLGIISGGDSSNGSTCISTETVNEVCKSITVNGETMSVDDYVAHVITNEFGGAPEETLKAQAIAARSYGVAGAKKDSQGNCVISDTSEGFQTYAATASERSIQAAKDTSGMVLLNKDGNVARAEYSSNSLTKAYSSFGNTITMSERNLEIPRDWYSKNKTCSDDSLNKANSNKDAYGRTVYGCGHGRGMGQIAAKYLAEEKNYTYSQIIEYFYGKDSPYQWTLGSSNSSSSNCIGGNGSFQPLSTYTMLGAGLTKLNRALSETERNNINNYINSEVDKAGYGTGAAVAAAGQALTHGLEQISPGYKLGYYWAGGHGDTTIGFKSTWGTNQGIVYTYGGNPTGPEEGMDCSGFVSWAIRNACDSSYTDDVSGTFEGFGSSVALSNAKSGDVITNAGHIILILKNNGDGSVTTAEESYSNGLIFNTYTADRVTQYKVVNMESWYKNRCKDTNPVTGNKRGSVSSSSSSNSSSSSSSSSDGSLKSQINSYLSSSAASGTWSVYVKNLKTNKVVDINASKKMNSASSIKLFVLASAYDKAKSGSVSEASFKANARKMIVYSDNSATNSVIDTIGGMSVVNSYVRKNGYSSTTLNRKFGGSYTSSGVNNYTSARDTGVLLEKIYNGSLVSSSYSKTMLDFLKNQNTRSKIPAGVSSGTVANKTGEIPDQGIENDSAIVYTSGADYVISVMSNTSNYSKAITDIAKISNIVYKYYNK